jgi:rhodanese-related sulfurtransferase
MPNSVQIIDVDTLKSKMDAQSDLCLIDVREVNEWNESHIPGATLIPKNDIPARIASFAPDKTKPIYLHCKAGGRSMTCAQYLVEMSYNEVYSVDGGITAWALAGFPVLK